MVMMMMLSMAVVASRMHFLDPNRVCVALHVGSLWWFGAPPTFFAMACRRDRSRSRDGLSTYHLVCYSTYSYVEMVVASRVHGMWGRAAAAGDANVLQMRRCKMTIPASSQSQHPWDPTCGAWELAGMALSLQLVTDEIGGIPQARTNPEMIDVTFHSAQESIVLMVLASSAGAAQDCPRHLQGLLRFVRLQVDALRQRGFRVKPAYAPPYRALQMRRVQLFACSRQCLPGHGWVWPDGLEDLLEASSKMRMDSDELVCADRWYWGGW